MYNFLYLYQQRNKQILKLKIMTTLKLTNLEITLKNEITNILDYSYARMQGWCATDLAPLKKESKLAQITLEENNVFLVCGKLKERNF